MNNHISIMIIRN